MKDGTLYRVIQPWEGKRPQMQPVQHDDEYTVQCPECGEDMDEFENGELWCRCGTGLRPEEVT